MNHNTINHTIKDNRASYNKTKHNTLKKKQAPPYNTVKHNTLKIQAKLNYTPNQKLQPNPKGPKKLPPLGIQQRVFRHHETSMP